MVPRSAIRTRFERPLSITLYSSVVIATWVVGGALHPQEPPPRWAARAAIGASSMHDDDRGTAVTVQSFAEPMRKATFASKAVFWWDPNTVASTPASSSMSSHVRP